MEFSQKLYSLDDFFFAELEFFFPLSGCFFAKFYLITEKTHKIVFDGNSHNLLLYRFGHQFGFSGIYRRVLVMIYLMAC